MIPGCASVLYDAHRFVSVLRGIAHDFEEVSCTDMEGAGTGNEDASGAQHFQGAQVKFLITAESFVEIALGLGKS